MAVQGSGRSAAGSSFRCFPSEANAAGGNYTHPSGNFRPSAKARTVFLRQQPIMSTEPSHFALKAAPIAETLRFPVPSNPSVRRFSKISVLVLPESSISL